MSEAAETRTTTTGNNIIFGDLKKKQKPIDVKIKNRNPKEPKITNVNTKNTEKQKYRKYKTKIEPKLLDKRTIEEDDDIIATIQKALGLKPTEENTNYTEVETSEAPFYKEPELMSVFTDIVSDNQPQITKKKIKKPRQQQDIPEDEDLGLNLFDDLSSPSFNTRTVSVAQSAASTVPLYEGGLEEQLANAQNLDDMERIRISVGLKPEKGARPKNPEKIQLRMEKYKKEIREEVNFNRAFRDARFLLKNQRKYNIQRNKPPSSLQDLRREYNADFLNFLSFRTDIPVNERDQVKYWTAPRRKLNLDY